MRRYHPLPASFHGAVGPDSVLLESGLPDEREATSLLFRDPVAVLALGAGEDPRGFLRRAEALRERGLWLAGYVAYEAGYPLVGVADPPPLPYPAAWLGAYRAPDRFDHLTAASTLPPHEAPAPEDGPGRASGAPNARFLASEAAWIARVERVLAYLEAGDSYQVNLTDAYEVEADDLAALYRRLMAAQPVPFGAFLRAGELEVASLSPELHFRLAEGRLVARPMKGTAARGRDAEEDAERAAALAADEKSRAENVMIVDLLRNDLGRVSETGSVRVEELFRVERYRTLLQMTSTVTGRALTSRLDVLLPALFPCGSITGAPKRRSMEIIRELEPRPRGVYTGAIGYAAPDGSCCFSVAIRTLTRWRGETRMGVGAGIVFDSDPAAEYRECRLKARFLELPPEPLALFETLRCDPAAGGLQRREAHLARLARSAAHWGLPFDPDEARAVLAAAEREGAGLRRVRLELSPDGSLRAEARPFRDGPRTGLRAAIARERIDASDPLRRHKTTARALYDAASRRAEALGLAELIFLNERGEVAEGAISNVFARFGGELRTPPLDAGALPGVLRGELLARGEAREAALTPADLRRADAVLVGNALRGLRSVRLELGPVAVRPAAGPPLP